LLLAADCAKADDVFSASALNKPVDVELGGLRQKILIETKNTGNPILLWLHGGPGTSEMFITHYCMNNLLDHFTIVHWDQRGTALSYNDRLCVADVSFDKILDDAFQLTNLLMNAYRQSKIFVIGHSFGSVLGIHLIDRHPECYFAYLGMGQVIDDERSFEITFEWLKNKLINENNASALTQMRDKYSIPRELLNKYKGIYFKGISLIDVIKGSPHYYEGYLDTYRTSNKFVSNAISRNPSAYTKNILKDIRAVRVPVYFFVGRHDRIVACAPELVVEYYRLLELPM
jgi:pimeloyl-ACP methyl ester carboxylesterase